jgi:hypothetical protein
MHAVREHGVTANCRCVASWALRGRPAVAYTSYRSPVDRVGKRMGRVLASRLLAVPGDGMHLTLTSAYHGPHSPLTAGRNPDGLAG